jgi:hypothetical protein
MVQQHFCCTLSWSVLIILYAKSFKAGVEKISFGTEMETHKTFI